MPSFTRRRLLPAAILALAAVITALVFAIRIDRTPTEMEIDTEGWIVILRNRFKYAFSQITVPSDIVKAELVDVDRDGRQDVLVATGGQGDKPGRIIALDTEGDLLWEFNTFEARYEGAHNRFVVIDYQLADLLSTGEEQIVFTARDEAWYPSRLGILNLEGQLLASYSHPGFINQFVVANFNSDNDLEILARADNNNLRAVLRGSVTDGSNYQVVFLLDSRNLEGEAFPPATDEAQSGHELWYAVALPQGQAITEVKALDYNGDSILDATFTVGKGYYHYVNAEGVLLGTRLSDAYIGSHPDGLPEVIIGLIRKDESGKWEISALPKLEDQEK